MALTASVAIRTDDTTGKNIKTGTDGSGHHIQFIALADGNGSHVGITGSPLVVTQSASTPTFYWSGASALSQATVVGSAASVREVRVLLDPAVTTARYLMLFNAASSQSNGATPVDTVLIPAQGNATIVYESARSFATGLVVAVSTSVGTLTLPGSGEAFFFAQHG